MCMVLNQTKGTSRFRVPLPHVGVPLFQNPGRQVSWGGTAGASKREIHHRASEPKHLRGEDGDGPLVGSHHLPQSRSWIIMLPPYTEHMACAHLCLVPSPCYLIYLYRQPHDLGDVNPVYRCGP